MPVSWTDAQVPVRTDFSNGDQFYTKEGQVIELPERRADRLWLSSEGLKIALGL